MGSTGDESIIRRSLRKTDASAKLKEHIDRLRELAHRLPYIIKVLPEATMKKDKESQSDEIIPTPDENKIEHF